MIRRIRFEEEIIYSIYDCDSKNLIGIFTTATSAAKYVFNGMDSGKACARFIHYFRSKNQIKDSQICKKIAVRRATETQVQILSGKEYIVMDGYLQPDFRHLRGFKIDEKISR